MAMVQIQEGHPRQQTELLYQVLSGALHEFSKADVELLGGHTTESAELTVGFTVLGSLDGATPLRKDGLTDGDILILSKPLGTGALLAGISQAVTRGVWIDEMLASMVKSNEQVARIARENNCVALTDVTGFGLAGHLLEMLDGSQVNATLNLSAIPLLTGFTDVVTAGIESTLSPANREVRNASELGRSGPNASESGSCRAFRSADFRRTADCCTPRPRRDYAQLAVERRNHWCCNRDRRSRINLRPLSKSSPDQLSPST